MAQELTAPLPPGLPGPLTLEAIYLVETDPQAQPKGRLELAGLAGDYAPSTTASDATRAAAGREKPAVRS